MNNKGWLVIFPAPLSHFSIQYTITPSLFVAWKSSSFPTLLYLPNHPIVLYYSKVAHPVICLFVSHCWLKNHSSLSGKEKPGKVLCSMLILGVTAWGDGREKWTVIRCIFYFPSWKIGNCEMGVHLASEFCFILHCPQLQQAPLGKMVYGDICFLHVMDRSLLLHDGVDGECGMIVRIY